MTEAHSSSYVAMRRGILEATLSRDGGCICSGWKDQEWQESEGKQGPQLVEALWDWGLPFCLECSGALLALLQRMGVLTVLVCPPPTLSRELPLQGSQISNCALPLQQVTCHLPHKGCSRKTALVCGGGF